MAVVSPARDGAIRLLAAGVLQADGDAGERSGGGVILVGRVVAPAIQPLIRLDAAVAARARHQAREGVWRGARLAVSAARAPAQSGSVRFQPTDVGGAR